ncbi:MAG TPA: DNA repair protein RecN, partial [Candidatus Limnocylindria bacterium]|nr:DNA repair protein RecN [Candidatus Limnocylindria bacterium]
LGEVVGRALWSLARRHQVLCVSHLAQVAAYADAHVKVRKEVRGGRTHVVAERLAARESASELADMLGAGGSSKSLAAGARELLTGAADWKAKSPRAR